jgi:hypothetical protein
VAVVGILASGSLSCRGMDEYVRADRLQKWVERTVAEPPADDGRWGDVTPAMRCHSGSVRLCDFDATSDPCKTPGPGVCRVPRLNTADCALRASSEGRTLDDVLHCSLQLAEGL